MIINFFVYIFKLIKFVLFYLWELTISNLRIAKDVLSPNPNISPGIIRFPLTLESPYQILAIANLITMTPGTISIDLEDDDKTLLIHAMYAGEEKEILKSLTESYEPQIRDLIP